MNAAQIVEAIKQRDGQTLDTASGPLVYSEAELARAIADEYGSLLIQLGAITPQQAKST